MHQISSTTENKIMIVGADCSVSTEPVAELAPYWNLVQVGNTDIMLFSYLLSVVI